MSGDPIREALQDYLDACDDAGWQVAHFVIPMGLQRINAEGVVESCSWQYAPEGQGSYISKALLMDAEDNLVNEDWD